MIVQNDQGTVADADAYVTVTEVRSYHTARGNALPGAPDDAALEKAIVRATDYVDQRFGFVGRRLHGRDQTTEWPRRDAFDRDRRLIDGIPLEVKEATAEYVLRALVAALDPDPQRDATGAAIQSKSTQVGPISTSVTFGPGAVFTMPRYPAADQKLRRAGLVRSGGDLLRA